MKKVFISFLFLLIFVPVMVMADHGAPLVYNYQFIPKSPDGCDAYHREDYGFIGATRHVNADQVFTAYYELVIDGELYIVTSIDNEGYYIKASDAMPKEDVITPDSEGVQKLSEPKTFLVYADSVDIKTGTSDALFSKVGTLKKGYMGTYQYYVTYSPYIYVEVDGVKGWVNMIDNKVLTKSKGYITVHKIDTKCGTIPANTLIEGGWDATLWDGESLIKYNDCETFYTTSHSLDIYSLHDYETEEFPAEEDIQVYDNADSKNVIFTIHKGEKMKVLASYSGAISEEYLYIEYKNQRGWMYYNYYANKEDKKESEEEQGQEEIVEEETPVEETEKPEVTTGKEKKQEKKKIDSKTIIIGSVIGAVVIAVVATVAIILVNKKKKGKVEPAVVEAEQAPQQVEEENKEVEKDNQ